MTRRFDTIEVAVISVLVAVLTLVANAWLRPPLDTDIVQFGHSGAEELKPYRTKYGPARNSRNAEEWIIRDFFKDRRDGVFLDIGSHHYQQENNSYYLETALGWSGIAIDAQASFGPDYAAHRPRTTFLARFVSDVSDSTASLFVPEHNTLVASHAHDFAKGVAGETAGETISVPTITLNDVLTQAGIDSIDFLSMDIELAEPKALAGFDIDKYRPELVCIESHVDVRQQILDYFQAHDYVLIGDYLRIDSLNLYFRPAHNHSN